MSEEGSSKTLVVKVNQKHRGKPIHIREQSLFVSWDGGKGFWRIMGERGLQFKILDFFLAFWDGGSKNLVTAPISVTQTSCAFVCLSFYLGSTHFGHLVYLLIYLSGSCICSFHYRMSNQKLKRGRYISQRGGEFSIACFGKNTWNSLPECIG